MAISLTIDGNEAALKKGLSIECVCINWAAAQQSASELASALALHQFSENRIFTDADDYSMEIELLLTFSTRGASGFAPRSSR